MNIIEVKNLSKKYIIDRQKLPYHSLRDEIVNTVKKPINWLRGHGERKEEFWALKDINFEVEQGTVLGIIGPNGAGKTTLLKILSRITPPTNGEAIIRGRISSLLEVGTGFHPELTGRENIYLNGAILGMSRKEIAKKFDEIVVFSGVEKFLDTPVKRYSSGMYVRLAFAVAAHLEPDILLIDEVLAVGDAEFQKKCLGRMEEVTKREGRTILFISHNMGAIRTLCARTILLKEGCIWTIGSSSDVIDQYLSKISDSESKIAFRKDRIGSGGIRIKNILFKDRNGKEVEFFYCGEDIQLWFEYDLIDKNVSEIDLAVGIDTVNGERIALISSKNINQKIGLREGEPIILNIKRLPLNAGRYCFTIFTESKGIVLDWIMGAGIFDVHQGDFYGTKQTLPQNQGYFLLDYEFL